MWAAIASVNLICNDRELKGLCPSDNEQRMCTCVVAAGDTLRWSATQPRVCVPAPKDSLSFSSANPVGNPTAHECIMGITAVLTNNTEGQLNSTLIFTPSAVSTNGLIVTCSSAGDIDEHKKTLNVTYSGITSTFGEYMYWERAWADFLTKLNNYYYNKNRMKYCDGANAKSIVATPNNPANGGYGWTGKLEMCFTGVSSAWEWNLAALYTIM